MHLHLLVVASGRRHPCPCLFVHLQENGPVPLPALSPIACTNRSVPAAVVADLDYASVSVWLWLRAAPPTPTRRRRGTGRQFPPPPGVQQRPFVVRRSDRASAILFERQRRPAVEVWGGRLSLMAGNWADETGLCSVTQEDIED